MRNNNMEDPWSDTIKCGLLLLLFDVVFAFQHLTLTILNVIDKSSFIQPKGLCSWLPIINIYFI